MPLSKCDWLWKADVTFSMHDDKTTMAETILEKVELHGGGVVLDRRPGESMESEVAVDTDSDCDEYEFECEESWCRLRRCCCCEMLLILTKSRTGVAQSRDAGKDTRQELQETGRRMIANECFAVIISC